MFYYCYYYYSYRDSKIGQTVSENALESLRRIFKNILITTNNNWPVSTTLQNTDKVEIAITKSNKI